MKPNLIHWNQFNICEKIASHLSQKEVQLQYSQMLVDKDTGEDLYPIEVSWETSYVLESFINTIETLVLSEQVDLVIPESMLKDNTITIPEHTTIFPDYYNDFIMLPMAEANRDTGAIDTSFYEWLHGESNEDDLLMIAKAYNSQYGESAVRITPGDHDAFYKTFDSFSEKSPLNSNLIDKAYDELVKSYKVKVSQTFANKTEVIMPPLVATFLNRLPDNCTDPKIFKEELMNLRKELEKVRKRFSDLQEIDSDPDISIKEAEKVINAVKADSEHFVKKWESDFTDHAVFQFCVEHASFLVKLITKIHKVQPEEIVGKLLKIAPGLEKRIRSSAPTIMSKMAYNTRKIKGINRLMEKKFGLDLVK